MSVRFKFRSEREYDTVVFDGAFVSVGELKRLIAEKRRLDEDAANELVLSTVQGVDYRDDAEQLPKSSSVLVKRAPALRSRAGARPQQQGPATQVQAPAAAAPARAAEPVSLPQLTRNAAATDAAASADPLKAAEAAAAAYAQEGDLIDSIVSGSASQWESGATVAAGGRGRGMGGRGGAPGMGAAPGRGMFMRGAVPPPNYLCGRCGQFGHYLRDCPTQGDPDFDMKRVRLPAGIPSTMLKRAPDGGILLPDGQTGFLQANKDALEKERQFLPTMADAGGDSAFGSGSAPTAKDPAQGAPCRLCYSCNTSASSISDGSLPRSYTLPMRCRSAAGHMPTLPAGCAPAALLLLPTVRPPHLSTSLLLSAGMFDDEDLPPVAAAKAVPLGIGMIEAAAPPSDPDQLAIVPVAQPTAAQQQQQPATAAAPSTAPRGRPGAMSSDEFSAALRWLDDFMPRAPPDALARAFNRAAPLPPGDFRALQAELAAAAAAGRRGGSPGAGPLGPPGPAAAHRGLPPHNREPSPSGRGYPLERDWQPGQPGGPGPYGREPPLLHRYPGPGGERYEERFRPPYFEDRRRPPSPGRRPMRFGGDGGGPPFDRRPPFDDRRPYDGPPPGRDYPAGRFHDRPGPDYARDRFAPGAYRPAERFVDGDRPPAFERRPSDRSLDSRVYPDAVPARERSPNRPRRPEERPGGSPGPLGRSGSGSQRAADLPGRPQVSRRLLTRSVLFSRHHCVLPIGIACRRSLCAFHVLHLSNAAGLLPSSPISLVIPLQDHPRERSRGEERLRRDAEEERLKSRGGSGRGGEERPASRNGGDREHSGERDERRGRTAGRERPQQSPSLEQPRSGEKRFVAGTCVCSRGSCTVQRCMARTRLAIGIHVALAA